MFTSVHLLIAVYLIISPYRLILFHASLCGNLNKVSWRCISSPTFTYCTFTRNIILRRNSILLIENRYCLSCIVLLFFSSSLPYSNCFFSPFLRHAVNCGRFCFWRRQSGILLVYLGNRWTDLRQIYTEDVLGPSLGRLWRSTSKVKVTRNKSGIFGPFGGLRAVYENLYSPDWNPVAKEINVW